MNTAIDTTPMQIMPDASGAPMVITVGRYKFAADMLGEIKLNLLAPVTGSRRESETAANMARAEYRRWLLACTSEAWRAANAAMYA